MSFIKERIEKYSRDIYGRIYGDPIELTGFEYCETGYKTANVPSKGMKWMPMPNQFHFGGNGKEEHCWIRGKIVIPDELMGKHVVLANVSVSDRAFNKSPQFMIYVDGKLECAFDQFHDTCDLDSNVKEHDLLMYVYVNERTYMSELKVALKEEHTEARKFYYDLTVASNSIGCLDEDSRSYITILGILNDALSLVDFTSDYEKFYASCTVASDYLKENLYDKYSNDETTCVCIGHTHIDVAWMWTFEQTREKVQKTFASMVKMMKKFPEFKFMSSQAVLYKFVKEDDPELYEEIKELVKEGRWEVEGSTWVESDTNLPSGESLVRQLMYGKKFFRDEFGVDTKTLWLPDCFGYSGALPQILKKACVDYFVTSKLSWNESNKMPYDYFDWKGIDGTPIRTYLLTATYRDPKKDWHTSYNADITPRWAKNTYDRFQQKELSDKVIITFGHGDGGGGPTEEMIENGLRLKNGLPGIPKVEFGFAKPFLDELYEKNKNSTKVPTWNGELYLEFHRGTYTSQAKNKKFNRKSEYLYHNAEFLSVIGETKCGIAYPAEMLRKNWENILLCQFHDVLPGSAIRNVYNETDAIYSGVINDGKQIVKNIYQTIAKNVKTYGGILVFNSNSFDASGEVFAEGEWRYVENIPAMGWSVVTPAEKIMPTLGEKRIENKYLRVEFNDNYDICRIYDKINAREVLEPGKVGGLEAYEDLPKDYDNWEISDYYKEKRFEINDLVSVEPVACGEKAGFAIIKSFRDSAIKQTILMDGHTANIEFDNEVDWRNSHILLKARYPFNLNATSASYDIQYGYIDRPTHSNTSWDAAKFEVCAHKYADISERGYGVSLINDCKYGYSAEGAALSLTLIKSGTYPDRQADIGMHKFTYVLYPHDGDLARAKTVETAYSYNNPMVCIPLSRQDGALADRFSLVHISGSNVIVDCVKKAENGDGYIIRLYDAVNSRSTKTLNFGFPVQSACYCDLLENDGEALDIMDNSITLPVKPFEIITIRVRV